MPRAKVGVYARGNSLMARTAVVAMAIGLAAIAVAARPALPAAPSAAGADMQSLVGTQWRFVEVAGSPVPPGVTAILRLRDGRASGRTGCNSFGASWQVGEDGGIRFSKLMSTKMACIEPAGASRTEHGVVAALRHAERMQREGATLTLLGPAGRPLATLEEEGAPRKPRPPAEGAA